MDPMSDTDPQSRTDIDLEALCRVATLVRAATRLANTAAGTDLRSPWLDVVAETVTASSYLTDIPDVPIPDWAVPEEGVSGGAAAPLALTTLSKAADELDSAGGRRDHRSVLVRAALTDAITLARGIRP